VTVTSVGNLTGKPIASTVTSAADTVKAAAAAATLYGIGAGAVRHRPRRRVHDGDRQDHLDGTATIAPWLPGRSPRRSSQ
jgi:hypothetical protein